jgi:hypothetical protein
MNSHNPKLFFVSKETLTYLNWEASISYSKLILCPITREKLAPDELKQLVNWDTDKNVYMIVKFL